MKDVSDAGSLLLKRFPGAGFWVRGRTPAFGQVGSSWWCPQGSPGGLLRRNLPDTGEYLLTVSHAFPHEFICSFLYFILTVNQSVH